MSRRAEPDDAVIVDDSPQDHAVAYYTDLYLRDCLSGHPRVEIVSAFLTASIVVGLLLATLMHLPAFSIEAAWLTITFLCSLTYHLREVASLQVFLFDEIALRIFKKLGKDIPTIKDEPTWLRRLARGLPSIILTAVLFVFLSYGTAGIVKAIYPIETLRNVPYTGGG